MNSVGLYSYTRILTCGIFDCVHVVLPEEEEGEGEEEEEEEEDIDEGDLILAAANMDNIDPAILANLPPSVQLDLMTKMREQKTYMNRDGFQQRQAQPLSFSQFQMDEYLKASSVRYHLLSLQRRRVHQAETLDNITQKVASIEMSSL